MTALERHADAAVLAERLLKFDGSAAMYNALAWFAYETGKVTEAHLAQARKAHELAGGKDVSVIDTLARILHRLGRTDEAVRLIKDSLQRVEPGFERNLLEQCLEDFGK